jgi:hypothetical protein
MDLILESKSDINVSIDGWKAPNKDEYIATCTHFIDKVLRPCLQALCYELSQSRYESRRRWLTTCAIGSS